MLFEMGLHRLFSVSPAVNYVAPSYVSMVCSLLVTSGLVLGTPMRTGPRARQAVEVEVPLAQGLLFVRHRRHAATWAGIAWTMISAIFSFDKFLTPQCMILHE